LKHFGKARGFVSPAGSPLAGRGEVPGGVGGGGDPAGNSARSEGQGEQRLNGPFGGQRWRGHTSAKKHIAGWGPRQ